MFKEQKWKERKRLYNFFKNGSLFMKQAEANRIWFDAILKKMRGTAPKIDEKLGEKRLSAS